MAYCAKLQEFHMGDKRALLSIDNNNVLKCMKAQQKCSCQLMPENDKSWPQEDDSGRKATTQVEGGF
jgi:hypothetical protein